MYATVVMKGLGAGLILGMCLLIVRYVWGVEFDVERVFLFIFGLAPIGFGVSAVCYIALLFMKEDE